MEGVCDTPLHIFAEMIGEMGIVWASFAAMKGVCDTPLHIFANNLGKWELFGPRSPPWRAYAIRPYTFSRNVLGNGNCLGLFAAMEGVCDTPLHIFAE